MDWLMVPDAPVMLGLALRATVLLSAALALAWLARKGPAGVRHLLWTMTFALLLGLPVLSLLGPSWELPLLRSPSSASPQPLPASAPVDVASDGLITLTAPDPSLPSAGFTAAGVGKPLSPTRSIPLPFLLWALGCVAGLASLAMSSLRFAGLVRVAHPLGDRDPASAGERGPPAAGDPRRRAALPQPGSDHTDDRWSVEACHLASRIGASVVPRAVERRADA